MCQNSLMKINNFSDNKGGMTLLYLGCNAKVPAPCPPLKPIEFLYGGYNSDFMIRQLDCFISVWLFELFVKKKKKKTKKMQRQACW